MASLHAPKHSVPPPWYKLQTSPSSRQDYITLPIAPSTPPIFLTAFHSNDGPALQGVLSIPSINDSLVSVPRPYTLADAESWINLQLSETPGGPWLQALRREDPDTGSFVGAVSLTPAAASSYALPERDVGDGSGVVDSRPQIKYVLGYYLHPELQKRGIVRDAVLALLTWAMAEKRVRDVSVEVAVDNVSSTRLVENLKGFEREEEEQELVWPETKGGGVKRIWNWRWKSP